MRFLTILFSILLMANFAEARVRIDLTNPNADPLPIALSPFSGDNLQATQLGQQMRDVIANNLSNTALFSVVDQKAYLQSPESLRAGGPMFGEWRLINTEAVLSGHIEVLGDAESGKARVEFRVYDVHREKQLVGRRYTVDLRFWRYVAHRISDDIYSAMTGEGGYFASRIVFIGEDTLPSGKVVKRLCVMDQDGANYQCLTDGNHLVLTPRFNPQVQKIIYMSYEKGVPRLYLLDLPTGKQELVGDFEGLNSSPRFSPDGEDIAMTLTKGHEGNPEIYTMDMESKKLKRLTFHRGIDTSPSYSPDGKWIVFNSDRGGKPALYIMNRDGNKVRRLTFGSGRYYAPVWSPRGDLIAFVKQHDKQFSIGVIDPEGEEERLLTTSYMDESPTWSPNGRVLLFSRQFGNDTKVYSIDLTGYNEREITTPNGASDPAWSPLMK